MRRRNFVILLSLATCLVLASPATSLAFDLPEPVQAKVIPPQTAGDGGIPTDQLIVKYRPAFQVMLASDERMEAAVQRLSQAAGTPLSYRRQMSGGALVLRFEQRLPLEKAQAAARRVMALPEVEYAEPDAILQQTLVPDDPRYPDQWHYFPAQGGIYGINAPPAWDLTTGAADIVAAVIDTGITAHADLSGRSLPGYDFVSDERRANDGDGRDADPSDPGDWITPAESLSGFFAGCPVTNSTWHGTHTAGTVGAASDNGVGVAGINWVSKILPVRVLGKCGGYTSDVVDGMRWAAGLRVPGVPDNIQPASVLNLSLGAPGACGSVFQEAIDAITAAGATVVASAGNNNTDAGGFSPGSCDGVITVAATAWNGTRAYYSNYGAEVEISAPGGAQSYPNDPGGVLSTWNTGTQSPAGDTYTYYQGTSMSAPHVTGVVSLMVSLEPDLLPAQVLQILQETATRFPAGSDCNPAICGSGILNAGKALAEVAEEPTDAPFPLFMPVVQK